jgi:hypothetical protein
MTRFKKRHYTSPSASEDYDRNISLKIELEIIQMAIYMILLKTHRLHGDAVAGTL